MLQLNLTSLGIVLRQSCSGPATTGLLSLQFKELQVLQLTSQVFNQLHVQMEKAWEVCVPAAYIQSTTLAKIKIPKKHTNLEKHLLCTIS